MNIYILSATGTYIPAIDHVLRELPVRGIIGLHPAGGRADVAGYRDYGELCDQHGIEHLALHSYSMSDVRDRDAIEALPIDLLLVLGWQRLVPGWLIGKCRSSVVGVHGSARGISAGRGRSPQNWAILCGDPSFSVSIFLIDEGVDSGLVIDTADYPLTEFDDIQSSYNKLAWLVGRLLVKNIRNGRIQRHEGTRQDEDGYYLPQRTPEDGAIDWHRSTRDIHAFVRALTRPYPGAFTHYGDCRIAIWNCRPFDMGLLPDGCSPGTIVDTFDGGGLLIRTGDGMLFVDGDAYQADKAVTLRPGVRFESVDFRAQIQSIISRHQQKHPNYPVAPQILALQSS